MDAISLLEKDHETVRELFERFGKAGTKAFKARRSLVENLTEELVRHMSLEEQLFYPLARERLEEDKILESLEEHHVTKLLLKEIEGLSPETERYAAKVTVLREVVEHHLEEEEQKVFPLARKAFSKDELAEAGTLLEERKKSAPTRPDPKASDTPTAAERGRITTRALAARTGRPGKKTGAAAKKPARKTTARKPSKR